MNSRLKIRNLKKIKVKSRKKIETGTGDTKMMIKKRRTCKWGTEGPELYSHKDQQAWTGCPTELTCTDLNSLEKK